jgi:hypothetical protein
VILTPSVSFRSTASDSRRSTEAGEDKPPLLRRGNVNLSRSSVASSINDSVATGSSIAPPSSVSKYVLSKLGPERLSFEGARSGTIQACEVNVSYDFHAFYYPWYG